MNEINFLYLDEAADQTDETQHLTTHIKVCVASNFGQWLMIVWSFWLLCHSRNHAECDCTLQREML